MPMVEISVTAFNYLKSLAEPFTDTPATVLDRLIAEHSRAAGGTAAAAFAPLRITDRYSTFDVPEMRFTKIEQVELEGLIADITKWNDLVEAVVKVCLQKGHDGEDVRTKLDANTVRGAASDAGFRYIEDARFSFQGLDAQRACEAALRLARSFGVSLKVKFRWRENPKALRPGSSAMIAA